MEIPSNKLTDCLHHFFCAHPGRSPSILPSPGFGIEFVPERTTPGLEIGSRLSTRRNLRERA